VPGRRVEASSADTTARACPHCQPWGKKMKEKGTAEGAGDEVRGSRGTGIGDHLFHSKAHIR
jgi:hypothetical protein